MKGGKKGRGIQGRSGGRGVAPWAQGGGLSPSFKGDERPWLRLFAFVCGCKRVTVNNLCSILHAQRCHCHDHDQYSRNFGQYWKLISYASLPLTLGAYCLPIEVNASHMRVIGYNIMQVIDYICIACRHAKRTKATNVSWRHVDVVRPICVSIKSPIAYYGTRLYTRPSPVSGF